MKKIFFRESLSTSKQFYSKLLIFFRKHWQSFSILIAIIWTIFCSNNKLASDAFVNFTYSCYNFTIKKKVSKSILKNIISIKLFEKEHAPLVASDIVFESEHIFYCCLGDLRGILALLQHINRLEKIVWDVRCFYVHSEVARTTDRIFCAT